MLKGGEESYEGDARCLACQKVSKHLASQTWSCPFCGHTMAEPADLNSPEESLEAHPPEMVAFCHDLVEHARSMPHLNPREVTRLVIEKHEKGAEERMAQERAAREPQGENPEDGPKPEHPAPPAAGGDEPVIEVKLVSAGGAFYVAGSAIREERKEVQVRLNGEFEGVIADAATLERANARAAEILAEIRAAQ